jgi:hypothetical protein
MAGALTIKDHVEAGHYPEDGAATLVPTRGGGTARIYTSMHPGDWPLVGVVGEGDGADMWRANGRITNSAAGRELDDERDLLPPSPRVVKVTAQIECVGAGGEDCHYVVRGLMREDLGNIFTPGRIIELTDESEVPW